MSTRTVPCPKSPKAPFKVATEHVPGVTAHTEELAKQYNNTSATHNNNLLATIVLQLMINLLPENQPAPSSHQCCTALVQKKTASS
jgi:hypothetical protein